MLLRSNCPHTRLHPPHTEWKREWRNTKGRDVCRCIFSPRLLVKWGILGRFCEERAMRQNDDDGHLLQSLAFVWRQEKAHFVRVSACHLILYDWSMIVTFIYTILDFELNHHLTSRTVRTVHIMKYSPIYTYLFTY